MFQISKNPSMFHISNNPSHGVQSPDVPRRRGWKSAAAALAMTALLPLSQAAHAAYPDHPINFIVPWGAGGGADLLARTSSKIMETSLGVSLPVINVPGADGMVGMDQAADLAGRRLQRGRIDRRHLRAAHAQESAVQARPNHPAGGHDPAALGLLGQCQWPVEDMGRPRQRGEEENTDGGRHRLRQCRRHHHALPEVQGHRPAVGSLRQTRHALQLDPGRERGHRLRADR